MFCKRGSLNWDIKNQNKTKTVNLGKPEPVENMLQRFFNTKQTSLLKKLQ